MVWNMQTVPWRALAVFGAAVAFMGCASAPAPEAMDNPLRKEVILVLTQKMEIISVNSGQPERVLKRVAIQGLPYGEILIGMDYRISKGVLFAMSRSGILYTLDCGTGVATAISKEPINPALSGNVFGFDFNPVADRIRVVSDKGQNLRLHPDTGVVAAVDPELAYAAGDLHWSNKPELVAAAYTYNKNDDKLTTNYAIDRRLGTLVTQGSVESVTPVTSPNTGLLRTVGLLTLGPLLDASFDISDVTGAGLAAVRSVANPITRLVLINLQSGKAELLGILGDGKPVVGVAVEP
ncbi:MAG: hypothetical protein RL392_1028 [Pseudomonadota bacterium]|jgi:hypothetical protein